MHFDLTEEQRMIRETARGFAENKIKSAAAEDPRRIGIGLEASGLAQAGMEAGIRCAKQRSPSVSPSPDIWPSSSGSSGLRFKGPRR